jgi:tetratricopeptide (TPR) repeat protein
MRYTLLILWIFLLPVSVLKAQDEQVLQKLLADADALIASNNLTDALSKTNEAIGMSANYHPALQKRINIYYMMKDEKQSVRAVEEAISKYPDIPEYYYLRGLINNERGKYIKALDDFTKGIDLKPQGMLYKYYLGRGISHYSLMEYDLAMADFNTSIEQNDTVASAYHGRAMVNYDLRDYEAAISDFLKALQYTSGNASLYFNLGMSYYRLNEKEKACPYFHKACTMGNTNACKIALMECAKAIPTIR